jgi:hypothetical protein
MRKTNCRIGFNDGVLMAIGIPLLSFIIPIVFMNCRFNRAPYFSWDKYVTTFAITAVVWIGNRYIMIYSRKKYPLFNEVRKRIYFQSVIMLVFTVVLNSSLGRLAEDVFNDGLVKPSRADILIHSNSAALFCTIMIIAIYESIYFMHQLKNSVEETENLKRENLKAQLDALRTQVNPHFLFNNLNTLSSLIPENPKHAVDFVQQLSKVYRHILEVKDEKSILLKDELEVLNAYTFLLKTRFDANLQVNINIVSSDKPLHIDVFTENGSLVISNNLQMKNQVNESTGIGLDNIRNRYKLLSDAPVKVTENDTNFTVSIPLIDN